MKIPKLYAFEKKLKIDLSLSENPLGCSPNVLRVLKKDIASITRYPDPDFKKLKLKLARKFKVSLNNISFGNGSENLIQVVSEMFVSKGSEVLIPKTTFPLFEITTLLIKGKPVFVNMTDSFDIDLGQMEKKITKKTRLIFICNPNNPTGKILPRSDIAKFVKKISPIPVVVDEANIEFCEESVVSDVKKAKNLIVLRTFSKAFGLAGLRIGVIVASEKIIKAFNRKRLPFPINALAERAAITAINDKQFLKKTRDLINTQREFMTIELRERGFMVSDSQTNNMLVSINGLFPNATQFVRLLNKNEVSVVNGNSFRGLGDQFIRLSPRLPETNKKFLKVVDKILTDKKKVVI